MLKLYILSSIIVLALFYAVPYILFKNVKSLALVAFWSLGALLWISLSIVILWRCKAA